MTTCICSRESGFRDSPEDLLPDGEALPRKNDCLQSINLVNMTIYSAKHNNNQPKNFFRKRKESSYAFSIVELLMVVIVILILLSILLPSLMKSKDQASKTTCAGNLRQLLISFNMYAGDYKGVLVSPLTNPVLMTTWNLTLLEQNYLPVGSASNSFVCPIYEPFHYSDANSSKVYGFRSVETVKYASDPTAAWNERHVDMGRIDIPSEYFLIGDSIFVGNDHQWYVITLLDLLSNLKVHARHGVSANVGFIDGSVRSLSHSNMISNLYNSEL